MKNQRGMAAVLFMLVLFIGLAVVSYFWWAEYEQKLAFQGKADQLNADLKLSKREVRDMNVALDDERSLNLSLKQQVKKLQAEKDETAGKLKEAETEVAQTKDQFGSLQQEIARLKISIDKAEQEKKKAIDDALAEQLAAKDALVAELDAAAVKAADLETEVAKLTEMITAKEQAISTASSTQEEAIQALEAKLAEAEAALTAESEKVAQYQQQLDNQGVLEEKNQTLSSDNTRLQEENSKLEKQILELNEALKASTTPSVSPVEVTPVSTTQI